MDRVLLLLPPIGGIGKLFLELVDPTCGINEFDFARIERVANTTNIYFNFRLGCSRCKFISTTTRNMGFNVFWMNALFHRFSPNPV